MLFLLVFLRFNAGSDVKVYFNYHADVRVLLLACIVPAAMAKGKRTEENDGFLFGHRLCLVFFPRRVF